MVGGVVPENTAFLKQKRQRTLGLTANQREWTLILQQKETEKTEMKQPLI